MPLIWAAHALPSTRRLPTVRTGCLRRWQNSSKPGSKASTSRAGLSNIWAESLARIHWRRRRLGGLLCGNFEVEKRDIYRRLDVRSLDLKTTGSKCGWLEMWVSRMFSKCGCLGCSRMFSSTRPDGRWCRFRWEITQRSCNFVV